MPRCRAPVRCISVAAKEYGGYGRKKEMIDVWYLGRNYLISVGEGS